MTNLDKLYKLIKNRFSLANGEILEVYGPHHRATLDERKLQEEYVEPDKYDLYFEFTLSTPSPMETYSSEMIVASLYVSYTEIYEISEFSVRVYSRLKQIIAQKIQSADFSELSIKIIHLIRRLEDKED